MACSPTTKGEYEEEEHVEGCHNNPWDFCCDRVVAPYILKIARDDIWSTSDVPTHEEIAAAKTVLQLYIIASPQTLLRRKATRENGPATELEPGTYTLSQELSVPVANLCLPSPYVPVVGVPLYNERLRLVQ